MKKLIITSTEIREEIKKVLNTDFIVITDINWDELTICELESFLKKYEPPEYRKNVFECEEISMDFLIEKRKHDAKSGKKRNVPIGLLFVNRYRGEPSNHYLNFCFINGKIYFIEPQNKKYWEASSNAENVIFAFI